MGTNIEFQGPGLICKGPYPVAELSLIGVMHVVGWEEVVKRVVSEFDYEGREWRRFRPIHKVCVRFPALDKFIRLQHNVLYVVVVSRTPAPARGVSKTIPVRRGA